MPKKEYLISLDLEKIPLPILNVIIDVLSTLNNLDLLVFWMHVMLGIPMIRVAELLSESSDVKDRKQKKKKKDTGFFISRETVRQTIKYIYGMIKTTYIQRYGENSFVSILYKDGESFPVFIVDKNEGGNE